MRTELRKMRKRHSSMGRWCGPMVWELKQRYNGYRVEHYNVVIDVLGGYSKHLEKSVRKLLGARALMFLLRFYRVLEFDIILNRLLVEITTL